MSSPFHLISSIILIIFFFFPGLILTAVVTLDSIKIYKTHEIFKTKPTVYFLCKGDNKTVLPDVKEVNVSYTFKGEESWQPLTELTSVKCKRCGFYERDNLKSDDVFDEWELCASDFADSGKFTRKKKGEFDATFMCSQCVALAADSNATSSSHGGGGGMHVVLVILISVLVSTALILGMVAAFKFWQKRKRQQDQARFLKLFEEGDDIEDELGLGSVL